MLKMMWTRKCKDCEFCRIDPELDKIDPDPFFCELTCEQTDPEHECEFVEGFEPKHKKGGETPWKTTEK